MTTSSFLKEVQLTKDLPTFADIETDGLYINCSLIQLRQAGLAYMVTTTSTEDVERMKNYMQDLHLVWYNASYDLGTLNFKVTPKTDDLFYAIKIAYPAIQQFSLDNVVSYLGYQDLYEGLDKKALQKAGFIRNAYLSQAQLRYAAADVEALERIWNLPKIQKVIESNLAYKLGIYALEEAMVWQQNGLNLLPDVVETYYADTLKLVDSTWAKLPTGLNPRSPKQVKELLSTDSSDKATLIRLAINDGNEIAEYILAARKASNSLSKLSKFRGFDHMLGRFSPMGTSTSRWACKGGDISNGTNLQNYSRDFKGVFGVLPGSGEILVTADYSTLEIRIACAIMGDDNMYKALMEGADIHKYTASLIFNKPLADITGRERSNSKVANFGFLYAMSAKTFVDYAFDLYGLKLTLQESKELRNKWLKAYPAVANYHDWVGAGLRKHNFITSTALGYRMKPRMYTDGVNAATQGTGAECGRLAIHLMVKKDKRTLQVLRNFLHDAFYLICPEDEENYWADLLSSCMVEAWEEISKSKLFKFKNIPMPVDVATGYSMSDLVDGWEGGGQALSATEMREQMEENTNE